ncbi:SidA/IucD/PvdA family monooxygenase [Shewanella sp. VB17]|nr:SidA/IucD/PvdA family monooxygenase [Shewanella sp. VB17]
MNNGNQQQTKIYDMIGVGIGPFNLSIAALSAGKAECSTLFLDKKSHFAWHPGLLLNDAKMQTSFLKDLVTAVEPTSCYSFLNYLVANRKFYPFMASGQTTIGRLEFSDYLSWVANQLPNVQFSKEVTGIEYTGGVFKVSVDEQSYFAHHLVMGTGAVPTLPECATSFVGDTCFHASELALRDPNFTGKRVAIIGGGQTGADVFQHSFDRQFGSVRALHWVSRRANIEMLDEGCFTDQYFMPDYVNSFYQLDQEVKSHEVERQKLTSDGITSECLKGIYQRLYHDKYVLRKPSWWSIQPNRSLIAMRQDEQGYHLTLTHGLTDEKSEVIADVVVMCTGFKRVTPHCLQSLHEQIEWDEQGRPTLSPDFSVKWQGDAHNRIYMVNAGIASHGIAEPQLSLAAWRAARILNHVVGKTIYDPVEHASVIDWGLGSCSNPMRVSL